jgi:hypothetical protein
MSYFSQIQINFFTAFPHPFLEECRGKQKGARKENPGDDDKSGPP